MYSLSLSHILDLFLFGCILILGLVVLVLLVIIGFRECLRRCETTEEVPLNTRSRTLLRELYALVTSHYSNERRRNH